MKHIKTFENYVGALHEGKKEDLMQAVIDNLIGSIEDEGWDREETEEWLNSPSGKTAIESALEGLEDEYPMARSLNFAKIGKEVIEKVLASDIFESADVNEGINSRAKALQGKFEDAILVADFGEGWEDVEGEEERINNIMAKLGTDPSTTLFASDANDEDGFEAFVDMVRKSGLKYEEAEGPDFVQEIYVNAK